MLRDLRILGMVGASETTEPPVGIEVPALSVAGQTGMQVGREGGGGGVFGTK